MLRRQRFGEQRLLATFFRPLNSQIDINNKKFKQLVSINVVNISATISDACYILFKFVSLNTILQHLLLWCQLTWRLFMAVIEGPLNITLEGALVELVENACPVRRPIVVSGAAGCIPDLVVTVT